MRVTLLFISIFFVFSFALSCEIPFNKKSGIPFVTDFDSPYVSGFEVDGKGDFYFCGADSIVRKIAGNTNEILFTTTVPGLRDGKIGLIGDTLWVVSRTARSTVRLTGLSPTTGKITADTLMTFPRELGVTNNGCFLDRKLIYDFSLVLSNPPSVKYVRIDPVSKTYQQVKNQYDINLGPDSLVYKLPSYLGKWDSAMVFYTEDAKPGKKGKGDIHFSLVRKDGTILGKKSFSLENTEMMLPSTIAGHERLMDGRVYLLRKKPKENKAAVIVIDLRSIPISAPAPTAP